MQFPYISSSCLCRFDASDTAGWAIVGPYADYFAGSLANLIAQGEASGDLIEALREGASLAEQQLEARTGFPGVFPMVVLVTMLLWMGITVIGIYLPIFTMAGAMQ